MVQTTLTRSDKAKILDDHVWTIANLKDDDIDLIEYVIKFLDAFKYNRNYKLGLYADYPDTWTPAYAQAVNKVACFFKYGDELNNGPIIPN